MTIKPNSIHLGDCLEIMKSIKDHSVDMILCDLPYGTTRNKWDSIVPLPELWEQYKRVIKPNGAIVLTASQPFTSALIMSNLKAFKYCWYWNKNRSVGVLNAKVQPLRNMEDVCIFNSTKYLPQGLKEVNQPSRNSKHDSPNYGAGTTKKYIQKYTGYPTQLLLFKVVQRVLHPTQKPVALFEYLIKTYSNEGDLILDNCAGSGTTGVACINTKRNYILIEKDPTYHKIILDRIYGL